MNFIENARQKALAPDAVSDPSAEVWAARAFSVIAVAGGMEGMPADIADSLAETIAKAPTDVVVSGTLAVLKARGIAASILPDNPF